MGEGGETSQNVLWISKAKAFPEPLADFHLSLLATLNIRESEETAL